MGVAEVIAFFKALPELVKVMGEVVAALKEMKQESIDKAIETIKNDVDVQIQILTQAKNDEERKAALLALSRAIAK
jgi:hypothetical protein